MQAIAYHFYCRDADQFISQILEVRKIMRRHGVEALPLWSTESGFEAYPEGSPLPPGIKHRLTRKEAAAQMAQILVLGAQAGLERFYYYAWDNERSGMVSTRGERMPAYEAMTRIQTWLVGSRMKGCVSPSQGVVSCRVESGNKQTSLIAWASQPGEQTLKLPEGMQVKEVETLFTGTPASTHQIQRGRVRIALGLEPVRIKLGQREQP